MCIIATGGLLGRLQWCIRHDFDDILMFPTTFWWYFDVSDIILVPFFTFQQLFSWIFWNCAPRSGRKHNSEYSYKAFLIKNLTFWTSKRPELTPFWWWFSALSLCCSLLSPSIRSMSPKLDLKNPRKYVYYFYRRLPWATSMVHPRQFSWHLDVSDPSLMKKWSIRHYFGSIRRRGGLQKIEAGDLGIDWNC